MNSRILAATACAFVTALAAAAPPAAISTDRMDRIVREYVDAKQFMGAVLVARGDEVLLSKGYGSANLEWTIPNPVPHHNFDEIPTVYRGPYEYSSPECGNKDWMPMSQKPAEGYVPPAGH